MEMELPTDPIPVATRNGNKILLFQRAVLLSYGGCAIAVVMAIPATLFGAVAKATDWSETDYGQDPEKAQLVLPLCLQVIDGD